MRYFPINIDTKGRKFVVAGGGPASEAKLRSLVKSDADIVLFAKDISDTIEKLIAEQTVRWTARAISPSDLDGATLVYAATEDAEFNSRIAQWARDAGILVNAADQTQDCSFITPAIVDRSPVTISISTDGTSPGLARRIKADIEAMLPHTLGALAGAIKHWRDKFFHAGRPVAARQAIWRKALSGASHEIYALTAKALDARVETIVSNPHFDENGPAHVYLVGAGPGDPDLLTLKARKLLHDADVIIYDRLVSQDILDLARKEADYVYVGKTPGVPSILQPQINAVIIAHAVNGQKIVRLKSGDPLIFGRADEEIAALKTAGIAFTIVPGITAAVAAAASTGHSLTTRGHNRAVALLTGHDAKGFAEHDWKSLASENARAAIYMGVGASRFIQGRLILHGASPDHPVTVVENASRLNEIVITTTLHQLVDDLDAANIKGPAIVLLGYGVKASTKQLQPWEVKHERKA